MLDMSIILILVVVFQKFVYIQTTKVHIDYMKLFVCQIYINKAIKLVNSLECM